ncbi:hypothetical protein RLEG12_01040 (plasmid) [Rhizobium leguminosarum bv. trifolii CB782]|nr:hypothetical protein RLEG12_01040 [Rhizobium leguminosarum bv. trifolii CB782]
MDDVDDLAQFAELTFEMWVYATNPGNGRPQGLLSLSTENAAAVSLEIAEDGHLQLRLQSEQIICRCQAPMPRKSWVRVVAVVSPLRGEASIEFYTKLPLPRQIADGTAFVRMTSHPLAGGGIALAIGAAAVKAGVDGRKRGINTFNGKIEEVRVVGRANDRQPSRLLAAWDFSLQMNTACIIDISGAHRHGVLVNAPTRAMTGHNWTGDEVDFRHVPSQYGAIHFHDDDLEEAGWEISATLTLPDDLPSGVYAVRLRGDGVGDNIPIFVLPKQSDQKADIAFLAPTFTYQAYANITLGDRDYNEAGISGLKAVPVARDLQLQAFPDFEGSLYEKHSDGSGRCYSSFKRPMFNFRADHRNPILDAPRNFGADLYLTSWLEHINQQYDVLTDHALDAEPGLLEGYKVLITGSHPEYWSGGMLTAVEQFLSKGGRLMYLGGNGFYWVTSQDPARLHIIECRRGYSGVRTWESAPGEVHLNTTGEHGGLWRYRGRAPNRLVGVGMASQGWDEQAPGYTKTSVGKAQEYAWVFAGVESDDFGDAGFAMNGASGDEIDRYDVELGSPTNAVVLGTSQGHSHFYKLAVEDVDMITDGLDGTTDNRVRSDIVLVEWQNSGKVFSVGSINWAASLAWNNFDNSVETVTRNVLLRFLVCSGRD